MQVNPHAPAEHVGAAFARAGHAEHEVPHVPTLFDGTHIAPQRWNPVSHATPHAPAVHVARPFVGAVHTVVHEPQWFGSVASVAHEVPHNIAPAAQLATQLATPAFDTQSGVVPLHVLPHVPQVVATSRRASHPFVLMPSQSP